MPTLKDALCLLAILIAYGVAGRMDYDDALMLQEVQRAAAAVECTADEALGPSGPIVQTTASVSESPSVRQRDVPCSPEAQ